MTSKNEINILCNLYIPIKTKDPNKEANETIRLIEEKFGVSINEHQRTSQ